MTENLELSVVVPVYNERENLAPLCDQLQQALGELAFEVVLVDDGSSDGSAAVLRDLARDRSWLRVVRHGRNAGQSAGIVSGVRAAAAPVIVTIDGDLQNDPADIPRLLEVFRAAAGGGGVLVAGNRSRRRDHLLRRISSRVANGVRRALLRDGCGDTGCSLKIFSRAGFLRLPQFDHMHRFLPALFVRDGARVINVPVGHRPRVAGDSKYGIGNRLWVGIMDLLGTRWLMKRALGPALAEPERSAGSDARG